MTTSLRLSRRTMLRGMGVSLALPFLEIMEPLTSLAAAAKPAALAPTRLAFIYFPNGVQLPHWTPAQVGPLNELPKSLLPLSKVKNEVMVLTGLAQDNAKPKGDGAGDHARSAAAFLTGAHPVKTAGANIRVGISADQIAAKRVGRYTNLPSLELGCEQGSQVGNCDSGYSCAYSSNISWISPSQPMAKETNPELVFERLFGNGDEKERLINRKKRDAYDKSILDFALEDARSLDKKLGSNDRRKLDEYLTAVREVERRLNRSHHVDPASVGAVKPAGKPEKFPEQVKLMLDLMMLAFRADLTRVCTMMLGNEGSNRSYPFIEVRDGHHDLSHHGKNPEKCKKIQRIDEFLVTQFAYFLEKLKGIKEGESNLLDQSMIVYGSGIGDGDRHNHDDLPILLAGRGNGTLKPGRHLKFDSNTPLNNLYLSLLDRMDVSIDSFGDATGRLKGLEG